MTPPAGPPMTLGNAATAGARLIVWCKAGGHQVEPGPAELARTYGPDVAVPDGRARLMCMRCSSRNIRLQGMAKQDRKRFAIPHHARG